jgi:hypothetical protein
VWYEKEGWWRCGNGRGTYILSEGPGESMGFVEVRVGGEGKVKGPLAFFGGRADCFAEPFRSQ